MKWDRLGKIIEKRHQCLIVEDADGTQWIGSGEAFFAAEDSIQVTKENALALCSIDKGKRDRIQVRTWDCGERFTILYTKEDEQNLLTPITTMNDVLLLGSRDGTLYGVETRMLKPIDTENGQAFSLRRMADGSCPVIAVFDDILCGAIVAPVDGEQLGRIMDLCCRIGAMKVEE